MANKVLDLLLKLTVQGGGEADALKKSIEGLKTAFVGFKGRSLDDILNGTAAKKSVDDVFVSLQKFSAELKRLGGIKIVDFDPTAGKLDLLVVKGRQFVDILAQAGRTRIDLNLANSQKDLDTITQKAREFFALVTSRGKFKIDLDLGKSAAEVDLLRGNLGRLSAQTKATGGDVEALAARNRSLLSSAEGLGREFLLFRRLLFGLGIITAAREVLTLVQSFDKVRQALAAVFGETKAKEEFAFVKVQADRLGISISDLGTEYARFTIASRSLGLTEQEIRDVFLATTEAGAKLALSSEQVTGALVALQQIASKGRLSMEELRQQLGDRLPGAISIAAKALGVTEAKLFAMVEAGQVASDVFLRKFPAALRASFNTDATTRIETTASQIQRFKNSISELIDTAIRAGALDAFVKILKELTALAKDPAFIQWLSDISSKIGGMIGFIREHAQAIVLLLGAYSGFKILSTIVGGLTAFTGFFTTVAATAPAAAVAVGGVAASTAALGKAASSNIGIVEKFTNVVIALAARIANPFTLIVVGVTATAIASIEAFTAITTKAWEEGLKLAEAQRQIGSQARIAQIIADQTKELEKYADTLAFSAKEIKSLSQDGLRFYNEAAIGAKALADAQVAGANASIASMRAELAVIQLSGDTSLKARERVSELIHKISDMKDVMATATEKSLAFANSLDLVAQRAEKEGIALDQAFVERMRNVEAQLVLSAKGANQLAAAVKEIKLSDLSVDAQGVAAAFKLAQDKGDSLGDSIRKALPKNFLDGRVKEINDVGNALAFLVASGAVPLQTAIDDLAKGLDKLTGNQLQAFAINAKNAFETGALSAKGFAIILEGQLLAALKNMGLDAETAGLKISKTFNELLANFSTVAQNAKATGAQIKGALDISIAAAKTTEELKALKATIEQLELAGGKFGDAIADSLLRLDDAIRISSGKIDSALGDSFKRLGISSKQELKAIGDQAVVDFERIKKSGLATTLELEAAWRKMAEEVTKLNNGIPPISILINAVDFNAFDLIVKAAEDATVRTRKAIEQAIPLAETKKQAQALGDAITLAFERGKISAQEFGKLITEVGFQIRELAAKPVGELAAAADFLGLKTKDQLKAMSDNAKEAFQIVASSGQFTNEQLAKGAQQFLDAYTAANSGVIDSFDPVVEKAMEVLASVQNVNSELDKMGNKANALRNPAQGPNLRELPVQDLQQLLFDTAKMYREIGVTNIEKLQIIQDIQAEMNRRGQESADAMKKKFDEAANSLDQGANNITKATTGRDATGGKGPAPGGVLAGVGGGVVNNNFNFNGTGLSPDTVKREVMPQINQIMTRRR